MMERRYFYRCADCLSVCTMGESLKTVYVEGRPRLATCGACGGWLEYMGRAQRDRLVKDEFRTPCDARCTNASGPNCDCRCGGENHGSHLWVEVVTDQGPVPVAKIGKAEKRKAEIYRAYVDQVRAAIEAQYGAVIARKCRGEYLGTDDFRRYSRGTWLTRGLHAAQTMRSHHGRNGKLAEMLKSLGVTFQIPEMEHAGYFESTAPVHTTTGKQQGLFAC